ncbi:MAG: gdhIV [Ilumatobacteraceae bacterium]|nr:gdhIV [Ilumatobacteraceae bacterium]
MRLADKVAVVVGAGQTTGSTIGNGRAIAMLFAREGARVLVVDRDSASAEATAQMIIGEGGTAQVHVADITDEEQAGGIGAACIGAFGRIDILVNNVGIGAGDSGVTSMDREIWDHIFAVNLTGLMLTCKHIVPVMRAQASGSIVNISSIAAVATTRMAAYTSSKAAVNALTQHMASANARYGVRVNAIMPGLLDTPMAIESISEATGVDVDQVRASRNSVVPLGRRMGTAWDTAYAALYLASDEAGFVTGAVLPVDGGQSARVG